MQKKQNDWLWQWTKYHYKESGTFLFEEWIYPNKLTDFKDKTVIDCGSGSGDHLINLSPIIAKGVGLDLNATPVTKKRFKKYPNLLVKEGDLATFKLKEKFDIVYSIGVLHHTDNPEKSFNNIKTFAKPGGKVIIWVYSHEGNFLNRTLLEFTKKYFFLKLPKPILALFGHLLTAALYAPIYTIYLLPLKFLPFYEYFQNWRRMDYYRNFINVFDKLNAPTTHFIKKDELKRWFTKKDFKNIHISAYKGVSWRASGTKLDNNKANADKNAQNGKSASQSDALAQRIPSQESDENILNGSDGENNRDVV